MATYLITGGTGFIGTTLVANLVEAGHNAVVITRKPDKHAGKHGDAVRYVGKFGEIESSTFFHAVINLGGEGIGDKRWSDKRKQELLDSRVGLTDHLVKLLARLETKPEVMISGSAVGWYGSQDETPLTEESSYNQEFTHELCQQWENSAAAVKDLGIRLCIIRLGIVLGQGGGALKRMLPPFYMGLGGRMGSGKQMMSWVHKDDVIKVINTQVNDQALEGVFNLTAPNAVTNAGFTRALGKAISRPAFFPLPGFVINLVFGEMGDRLLLHGQNVVPARLQQQGYDYEYPDIESAFAAIFER